MFNFNALVRQALLAITLACGSAAAFAGPTYHVNVNTTGLSGTGLMDFVFLALEGTPAARATVTNFSGAFGAEFERAGEVSGAIPGTVSILNTGAFNALTQTVSLGGLFAFDISFDGEFLLAGGNSGTTLGIALYNDDFSEYLGFEGNFAQFELTPVDGGMATIGVSGPNALADVAVVPEPSELLLLLTGLGMMGMVARRRRGNK